MRHDYVMHVVPVALSINRNTWHKSLVAWHKSLVAWHKSPSSLGIKSHRRQCNVCDSTIKQHNKNTIIAHQNWHKAHIAIIYPHQDKYIIASYLHYAKHHQTIYRHQKSCIHKLEAFINNINIIIMYKDIYHC